VNIVATFLRTRWDGNLLTCGMVLAALLIGMLIYLVLFSMLSRIANRADSLLNTIWGLSAWMLELIMVLSVLLGKYRHNYHEPVSRHIWRLCIV